MEKVFVLNTFSRAKNGGRRVMESFHSDEAPGPFHSKVFNVGVERIERMKSGKTISHFVDEESSIVASFNKLFVRIVQIIDNAKLLA